MASEASEEEVIGWARPANSQKHHAFGPDKRSLCAKWMFLGALDFVDADKASADDCKACRRKYDNARRRVASVLGDVK